MGKKYLDKIDYFFNKVVPKKLIVWITATIALFMKLIDGNVWGIITGIYLGVNIIGKFAPFISNNNEDKTE